MQDLSDDIVTDETGSVNRTVCSALCPWNCKFKDSDNIFKRKTTWKDFWICCFHFSILCKKTHFCFQMMILEEGSHDKPIQQICIVGVILDK